MTDREQKIVPTTVLIVNEPDYRAGYRITPHGIAVFSWGQARNGSGTLFIEFVYDGRHHQRHLRGYFTQRMISRAIGKFVKEVVG